VQTLGKIFFAAIFLALAYWCRNAGVGHKVVAYFAGITLMVYAFCALGLIVFARIPSKGWESAAMGLAAGAIVGIAAGIPLGRAAASASWLYWTVVLVQAGVMAFLPRLY
jgi:hypothetical protein